VYCFFATRSNSETKIHILQKTPFLVLQYLKTFEHSFWNRWVSKKYNQRVDNLS